MQRQVPQVQAVLKTGDVPSINQGTKLAWIPQTQNVDDVVDMPVVVQRQVPQVQTVPSPSINQVTEDPADSLHRQGCRHACGDATTSTSESDGVKDRGNLWRSSSAALCDLADAPVPQILGTLPSCRHALHSTW